MASKRRQLRSTSKKLADTIANKTDGVKGQAKVNAMVFDAITNIKQPKGCSRQSILKYIIANNKLADTMQNRRSVVQSIERNIRNGSLVKAGKTGCIKLAEKAREIKETKNPTGKGKRTMSKSKKKRSGEESNKRKQPARKREANKPSIGADKKGNKHTSNDKKVPVRPKRNKKETPIKQRTGKQVTTHRKRNKTDDKRVEQKATTAKTKNQSKSKLLSSKTVKEQRKRIGPKNKVPLSTRNTQHSTPSVEDVAADISTEIPDITMRHLDTIPIDTEEKRFSKFNVTVSGITVAKDGRKLVAVLSGLIQLYSTSFKLLSSLQLKNATLYDTVIYSENEAIVATGSLLYLIDFSRNVLTVTYTFFETPYLVSQVTSCRDDIFVTCLRDTTQSVKKIDSTGNVYWTTEFHQPHSITSYAKGEKILVAVTGDAKGTLTLLDGDSGDVIVYRPLEMLNPRGCTSDSSGNIFLFYMHSYTQGAVSFISADFTMEKVLSATKAGDTIYPKADSYDLGLTYPVAICWDETRRQLLVAVYPDNVRVFAVE